MKSIAHKLALMLSVCMLTQVASADQEGEFTYSISNDLATITKYTGKEAQVTFPAAINGKKVTTIGAGRDNPVFPSGVTKVVVPEGVLSINVHAFADCDSLAEVSLPKSLASIGMGAFFPCPKLKSISIPSGVTRIEGSTFKACDSLERVELPGNLAAIEAGAFQYCSNLTSISFPQKLERIGPQAFQSTGLTQVTIPASITDIGFNAFFGCKALTSATFEGDVPASYGKGKAPNGKIIDDYQNVFLSGSPEFTIRYYKGKNGFDSPKWNGQKMEVIERSK